MTIEQELFRVLSAAAKPYGFRSERYRTRGLPDLVLTRPMDGRVVLRMRCCEEGPGGQPCVMRIIPAGIPREEGLLAEVHFEEHLVPALETFGSYDAWYRLPGVVIDDGYGLS